MADGISRKAVCRWCQTVNVITDTSGSFVVGVICGECGREFTVGKTHVICPYCELESPVPDPPGKAMDCPNCGRPI